MGTEIRKICSANFLQHVPSSLGVCASEREKATERERERQRERGRGRERERERVEAFQLGQRTKRGPSFDDLLDRRSGLTD